MFRKTITLSFILFLTKSYAQSNSEGPGSWYMYFFNTRHQSSTFGFQGDIQYRNWNFIGDLEQLLLRGGITYKPKNESIKFTLGYGNITSGVIGSSKATSNESRIYQEALFSNTFGGRFHLTHRFRYEQRFLKEQNLRTRYRYNLFLNIALNAKTMKKNTLYVALYNELFVNGQKNINNTTTVEYFDRNRLYAGIGYYLQDALRIQVGFMNQTNDATGRNQVQFSLHHAF